MNQKRPKVALITGSAKRTGKDIAIALAKEGYDIVIHYNTSKKQAQQTVKQIQALGRVCYCVKADLTKPLQVKQLIKKAIQKSKRIDVLINNVGGFIEKDIDKMQPKEWQTVIDSTVNATFFMCHETIPHMIKGQKKNKAPTKNAQISSQKRIINIGEAGADHLTPHINTTAHHIGKVGVLLLTKALAKKYSQPNLTVNCVSPGTLDNSKTKTRKSLIPKKRYGTTQDVVNAILFLLKDESEYITGAHIKVSGGWKI